MLKSSRRILALTLLAATATVALALTLAEAQSHANALSGELDTIDLAVEACPEGQCSERAAIEAAFDAADADRLQLHAERSTLDPCTGCQSLDAAISEVDSHASTLRTTILSWDEGD